MASGVIQKCISALTGAATDTERFAALLLVPKAICADCSESDRRLLFDAVGFDFVSRLLISESVPTGCPPYLFRAVALSVLAAFCTVPEFARSSRMADKVPHFLEVLTDSGFSKEERAMKNDALTCLLSLTANPESCRSIVDNDGMAKLCTVYAVEDARHNFKEQLFSVISSAISQLGVDCWNQRPQSFHVLMNTLAQRLLAEERSQRKFVMCDVIRAVLSSFPVMLRESSAAEPWYQQFNEELLGILCFKLGDAQREPLLKLCAALTDKLGVPWALGPNAKSLRMYFLLVQLSCIEVRMIAEERTFEEVMQKSELATACFTVLESAIQFLIEDNGQVVTEKSQQQLYCALTAAFAAVLGFLKLVAERLGNFHCPSIDSLPESLGHLHRRSIDSAAPESLRQLSELEREFLVAAIRVSGAWLAEETATLREDVYKVLPFLLQVVWEERECRNSARCLRFLLPALCHLSVEDPARAIMLEKKMPEVMTKHALELWETFKEETFPDLDEPQQADKDIESETENALTTICAIQMNVVVLEAENVVGHPGFYGLLQFVFGALPEVDMKVRHLVLRGNLATLGLLLLRRFPRGARASESAMYRYLSATIRFLWDAFNVEDSSDGSSLVVNFAYRAVWDQVKEMWYLGMQALSSLLPSTPWIAEFIVESGWAQEIVATLGKANQKGLDGSVRTAYEDFLCCLVRCCDDAAANLKEHGAMKMCGVHKMKELGRMLRLHASASDVQS